MDRLDTRLLDGARRRGCGGGRRRRTPGACRTEVSAKRASSSTSRCWFSGSTVKTLMNVTSLASFEIVVIGRSTLQQRGELGQRSAPPQLVIGGRDVAASLSTFGQHPRDYVSRVKQDCSVFLCRELDEAQSPEQEKSFDGQQGMTNVLGGTRF
jgi:hypothetical protein